jgi:acetoin utilization deacetylase AcuC-like enzyme
VTAARRFELHAWTSHHHPVAVPEGHPFPAAKYAPLLERLTGDGTLEAANVHRSEPAPVEWLTRVHDAQYVARVLEGRLSPAEVRVLGLPWSEALVTRARAATFGTVQAARAAFAHGVAGNLAGGSHHAFRDRGEAFCVFNDFAVAIASLRVEGRALRPFVLDLDVHQGNGTAAMFREDASAFTFSLHGASNYPARKERSTIDVELRDGCGDDEYLDALAGTLPAALDAHAPDVVFYQAGVDGLAGDRFGRLALTLDGIARRDAFVFERLLPLAVPVVVTLGGGYSRPLDASIAAHAAVWRAMRAFGDRRAAGVHAVDGVVDVDSAR